MFFKEILLTVNVILLSSSLMLAQLCIDGDCLNGKGVMMDRDSNMLIGHFENGVLEGKGVCYYSWGAKYVGYFQQGAFEGEGTYFYTNGSAEHGIFENGTLVEKKPFDATTAPTRVKAIVIGINNYPTQKLRFGQGDAEIISRFLNQSGASVTTLYDEQATKEGVNTALSEAIETSSSDEVLMFFFFGLHQYKELQLIDGAIALTDIQMTLNQSKASQTISFFDLTDASEQLVAMKRPEKLNTQETNQHVFTYELEKKNEYSIEFDGLRHGVYTHYLMQALQGAADADLDGQVSQKELFQFTSRQLRDYSDGRLFLKWQQDGTADQQYIPSFSNY